MTEGIVVDMNVLNIQGNRPSSGEFKSYSISSYEEKVKAYAKRTMNGRPVFQDVVLLEIQIFSDIHVDPVGVAKGVLDALTGTVYEDDRLVKGLNIDYHPYSSTKSGIFIIVQSITTHFAPVNPSLEFYVPHTPVEKGLCYTADPERRELYNSIDSLGLEDRVARINRPRSAQEYLSVKLKVESSRYVGDIDNLLRGCLDYCKTKGALFRLDNIRKYSVRLYDQPELHDRVMNNGAIFSIRPIDSHLECVWQPRIR